MLHFVLFCFLHYSFTSNYKKIPSICIKILQDMLVLFALYNSSVNVRVVIKAAAFDLISYLNVLI